MSFKAKFILCAVISSALYITYRVYGDDIVAALYRQRYAIIGVLAAVLFIGCWLWGKLRKRAKGRGKGGAVSIPKGSVLIIDTNVWMNPTLTKWFTQLSKRAKTNKWTIHLESIVLGELKGLTKNPDKAKDAHAGMKRIEELQISIPSNFRMEDHANRKTDYLADKVLLRYAKSKKKSILVTDDRELRILAREKGITAMRPCECKL